MSSNIFIQKVCQFCNNEFTARTTVTKYCSDTCAKRAYKQRIRQSKINNVEKEVSAQLNLDAKTILKEEEFLSANQTAILLGVGRTTIYRYLISREIKCVQIRGKTFIRRCDIDKLFDDADLYEVKEVFKWIDDEHYQNETKRYKRIKGMASQYSLFEKDQIIVSELNPEYAEAYYNKGLEYTENGHFNEAIDCYSKVIDELDPQNPKSYLERQRIYNMIAEQTDNSTKKTECKELALADKAKYDELIKSQGVHKPQ